MFSPISLVLHIVVLVGLNLEPPDKGCGEWWLCLNPHVSKCISADDKGAGDGRPMDEHGDLMD